MNRLLITLSLLLVSSSLLFSQKLVVTKTDGSEVIGTMLSESADALVLRGKNDAGIGVDITISKADISEQRPWGPNDRDYEPILELLPSPDLQPTEAYREHITGCQRYLEIHKESATPKQRREVQKILTTLESELALVQEGGLKFDGRWIKKDDRETNEYEIDMRIAMAQMKQAAAEANHRKAMQIFDEIKRDFAHSERFEEARALALETLAGYKRVVAGLIKNVDAKVAAREKSLVGLGAAERAAEEAAIKRIDDRYQRLLKADEDSKTPWLYLDEFHKEAMDKVMRSIVQEESNLSRPAPANAKVVGPIYREVWGAIRNDDLEAAEKLVVDLKSLKVPQRYLDKIDAKINPPEPEPAPEPDPAAPTDPETTPSSDTPAPEETTPKSPEKKDDKKEVTTDEPTPEPKAKEEEKGFPTQLVLVVVLVLVIAGALVAALGGKKK